jgi:hypothetical protein
MGVFALLAVILSLIMGSQSETHRRWQNALLVFFIVFLCETLTSCGGGGGGVLPSGGNGSPGTSSGSYTIVLTGTYGSGTRSINLGLTVR